MGERPHEALGGAVLFLHGVVVDDEGFEVGESHALRLRTDESGRARGAQPVAEEGARLHHVPGVRGLLYFLRAVPIPYLVDAAPEPERPATPFTCHGDAPPFPRGGRGRFIGAPSFDAAAVSNRRAHFA